MSRVYESASDSKKGQKYICNTGKIFAGEGSLATKPYKGITINDDGMARKILFTLQEQNQYCRMGCKAQQCCLEERKAIVDTFLVGRRSTE